MVALIIITVGDMLDRPAMNETCRKRLEQVFDAWKAEIAGSLNKASLAWELSKSADPARQLGDTSGVESRPGEGATFRVPLPARPEARVAA